MTRESLSREVSSVRVKILVHELTVVDTFDYVRVINQTTYGSYNTTESKSLIFTIFFKNRIISFYSSNLDK